jgi:hypothetical protein
MPLFPQTGKQLLISLLSLLLTLLPVEPIRLLAVQLLHPLLAVPPLLLLRPPHLPMPLVQLLGMVLVRQSPLIMTFFS